MYRDACTRRTTLPFQFTVGGPNQIGYDEPKQRWEFGIQQVIYGNYKATRYISR